jgi:hypothetical protein
MPYLVYLFTECSEHRITIVKFRISFPTLEVFLPSGYCSKPCAPDGASGGTPECPPYQPSPVLPTDASALYTLPGASPGVTTTSQSFPGASHPGTSPPFPGPSQPISGASHGHSGAVLHGYHMTPDPTRVTSPRDNSRSRRLSLDPGVRLKVSKLEMVCMQVKCRNTLCIMYTHARISVHIYIFLQQRHRMFFSNKLEE